MPITFLTILTKKFRSLFGILLLLNILFFGFMVWAGNTGQLNDPSIYYSGRHAQTGEIAVIQGCRPERILPDGSCDKSFRWSEFFGSE